jgi:endonuclease V-like protein UPF0215 family
MGRFRPHVLGIDDGPFEKGRDASVPVVGVMTEGADLVEAVAVTRFPVDGAGAAEFLAGWVRGLRCAEALHAVVLGGVTIAGLAVVDVALLSSSLGLPVLVVNRRDPVDEPLAAALDAAGLSDRRPILERTPRARPVEGGLYAACAGAEPETVQRLLDATRGKSQIPEPLRLAHLVAAAIVRGESKGRP